jgi:hypothetical protein
LYDPKLLPILDGKTHKPPFGTIIKEMGVAE